jgi:hypothetical protein
MLSIKIALKIRKRLILYFLGEKKDHFSFYVDIAVDIVFVFVVIFISILQMIENSKRNKIFITVNTKYTQ